MKFFTTLLITLFIVAGCGGGFDVTKNISESDPSKITYESPQLRVKSEYEAQKFFTDLQFFCYQDGQEKTFSIAASYVSNQWPFFEKIIFNIDGSEFEFEPDRPPTRDLYNMQGPTETITVQVPEKTIVDIYESMDTRMTVKGYDFQYEVLWKDDIKLKLYEFHKATMN